MTDPNNIHAHSSFLDKIRTIVIQGKVDLGGFSLYEKVMQVIVRSLLQPEVELAMHRVREAGGSTHDQLVAAIKVAFEVRS